MVCLQSKEVKEWGVRRKFQGLPQHEEKFGEINMRIMIDTNVIVSAVLFPNPRMDQLMGKVGQPRGQSPRLARNPAKDWCS